MDVAVPSVEELAVMTPREVEIAAHGLEYVRRVAEARSALMVSYVDAAGAHLEDGHRNVAAWGRATNNWSGPESSRLAKLARAFQALPGFATASLDGRIGVAQMHAAAAVAANPRVREHLEGADELFTSSAEHLDFVDFSVVLRHWEELADADGARSRHDRAVRDRRASVKFVGERAYLDAQGSAHDGVVFEAVLEHFTQLEWQTEWDMLAAVHGDAMCPELMERTHAQRCFDALQRVFAAAAASKEAGAAITVNMVIDQRTFEDELARLAGEDPEPVDPNVHAPSRRCEDAAGHVLDPRAVAAMALAGHVRRMVIGSDGVVLDMGRRQRLFTGPLRDAVLASSRTCSRVGCNVPGQRCQADHLTPYAAGGNTVVMNGAPACGPHNRDRARGFRTVRDPAGRYHTIRPDGTEVGWPMMYANLRFLGLTGTDP